MKSLNKKISAIVLASMVVMGGVLSSGVSSFAASAKNVSVQEYNHKKVEFFVNKYGQIIDMNKDENNLEKIKDRSLCYNNGKFVKVKYASQISAELYRAQYSGRKFVKLQFDGVYYLIKIK